MKQISILNCFKAILVGDIIPSDFPKYIIGSSKEKYLNVVDVWIKNNNARIKQDYKTKTFSTK